MVRVTRKPLYGFKPKNKEEREVPVPESLIGALKKYKGSMKPNADALVFPNESGRPDQAARIQTQAHRLPGANELWAIRLEAREQMFRGTVLLEFLPAQIQAYICDPKPAGSRLRYKNATELDGTQGFGVDDGLPVYLKAVRNKDVMARVNSSELAALTA